MADVVLRQGRKEEGAQAQVYPEKKAARGVLRAPLTMEWVATAEATEVSMMEWLLATSSCTERERVVRGNAMTRRRDDAGKAAAR
jgi:hypothetical protein